MLCTGETVGVCKSVFETQQGEYIDFFFSQFSRNAINDIVITRSKHIVNIYPRYRFQEKKERKRKINATENV